MIVAAGAAIAALLVFTLFGRRIAQNLPPAIATMFLVLGSVVTGGAALTVLGMLAAIWLGGSTLIAHLVPWSPTVLAATSPIPAPIGQLSGGLLLILALFGGVRAGRRLATVAVVLGSRPGLASGVVVSRPELPGRPVVVVDDPVPDAFATPWPHGNILLTSGLVESLTPARLRVVLLHEEAHLRYHHGWLRLAVELTSCLVPCLGPISRDVGTASERWADEYAASRCGDRRAVARTVAQVGLLRPRSSAVAGAASASGGNVVNRVQSMLAPAPVLSRRIAAVALGLLLVGGISGMSVAGVGGDLFEDSIPATVVHHAVASPP